MNVKDYNQKVKYYFNCAILYFFCKKPHFFRFYVTIKRTSRTKTKKKISFFILPNLFILFIVNTLFFRKPINTLTFFKIHIY